MTHPKTEQELAQDHEKVQKLIRSALIAFAVSIVIGIIGGIAVYQLLPEGRYPAFVLYLPGIIAVIITCLPIRKRKKQWFPNAEDFKAAAEYKPKDH